MDKERIMIRVDHVTKKYRLGMIDGASARKDRRYRRTGNEEYAADTILAVNDVSFDVTEGEVVGIVGHNGAGKSTLLKMISAVTVPTEGEICLGGKVASMLEVGTGFNPELTGRENIYLNGAILGMKRKEIDAKIDEIIEFSECGRFIDTPVKRYSSGMYMKLAFSVAVNLDAEIVMMDEVLAVGDVNFRNKCIAKIMEISRSGRTILFVSHNIHMIRMLCKRCIVMNEGRIEFDGDVEDAVHRYVIEDVSNEEGRNLADMERVLDSDGLCHMEHIELIDGKAGNAYETGEKLHFRLSWTAEKKLPPMQLRIGIWTDDKRAVGISYSEIFDPWENGTDALAFDTEVELDISGLAPGKYNLEMIMLEIFMDGSFVKHDALRGTIAFSVSAAPGNLLYSRYNNSWGYFDVSPAKIESSRQTDGRQTDREGQDL